MLISGIMFVPAGGEYLQRSQLTLQKLSADLRPACRTESQDAREMVLEFMQIWLQSIQLYGLQRDEMYCRLQGICRKHGV
jgi:hypothetical protein